MGLTKNEKAFAENIRTEHNREEAMSDHVTRRRFNAGIGAALMSPGLVVDPAFAQGNSPVRIGLIMPYSGQFADTGIQIENGIKLYMKQHGDTVAGRKIELIKKDVGGPAPDVAKRLAQELVTRDNVDILAGFSLTPNALAAAPRLRGSQKIHGRDECGHLNHHDKITLHGQSCL